MTSYEGEKRVHQKRRRGLGGKMRRGGRKREVHTDLQTVSLRSTSTHQIERRANGGSQCRLGETGGGTSLAKGEDSTR